MSKLDAEAEFWQLTVAAKNAEIARLRQRVRSAEKRAHHAGECYLCEALFM